MRNSMFERKRRKNICTPELFQNLFDLHVRIWVQRCKCSKEDAREIKKIFSGLEFLCSQLKIYDIETKINNILRFHWKNNENTCKDQYDKKRVSPMINQDKQTVIDSESLCSNVKVQ